MSKAFFSESINISGAASGGKPAAEFAEHDSAVIGGGAQSVKRRGANSESLVSVNSENRASEKYLKDGNVKLKRADKKASEANRKRILARVPKPGSKAYKFFSGAGVNILVALLAVIWFIPIVWVIAASFKGENTGLLSTGFFPTEWTGENYVNLFEKTKFLKWVENTLIIAVLNTVFSTFFTLCAAYALSRFRFRARKKLMNISLILGMFPGFMSLIAIYLILNELGLIGQIWGLLLVYVCGAGLGFFVTKGYFDTISSSLDEAAYIEGASQFRIFFKIFLPLAKPIIIYTALMAFMMPWTDYILAGMILTDTDSYTVAVGLYQMTSDYNISLQFTMFAAGCVLVAVPIVILYLMLQKFMVEGISAGAVKG